MGLNTDNQIHTGLGGLPAIDITAPDGAKAEIYLHGGHVASWIPAGGGERLFLSEKSEFRSGVAIRGGVPVIFPQFNALGPLPRHGFARTLPWELIAVGGGSQTASARLALQDSATTLDIWPHHFRTELEVSVGGTQITLALQVTNSGDTPFTFTGALHTYFRIADIHTTHIDGLKGARFHDTVDRATPVDWIEKYQSEPEVNFPGEVDRVYYAIRQPLRVCEADRTIQVSAEGFPDVVIWNPGPEKAARLADMEINGYQRMVCVEAAIVGSPVKLQPGDTWQGFQRITA